MKRATIALLAALGLALAACGTEEAAQVTAGAPGADGAGTDQAVPEGGTNDDATPGDGAAGEEPGGEPGRELGSGAESDPVEASDLRPGSLRSILPAGTMELSGSMSSARFEARVELVGVPGSELSGPVSITLAGAYDEPNRASELMMDLGDVLRAAASEGGSDELAELEAFAAAFAEPLQIVTIGDRSWIKWGLLAMLGVGDDMWLEGSSEGTEDLSSSMGLGGGAASPTDLLDLLGDADADLEVLGSEDLRGASTTHYRVELDVAALAGGLDADDRAALESELGASAEAVYTVEFWLDGDERLHRLVVDIDDIPPGAGVDDLASMRIVYDLWDHGLDLGITPPPADQILTEDELGFEIGDLSGFGAAS